MPDRMCGNIHPIDGICELANQPNPHAYCKRSAEPRLQKTAPWPDHIAKGVDKRHERVRMRLMAGFDTLLRSLDPAAISITGGGGWIAVASAIEQRRARSMMTFLALVIRPLIYCCRRNAAPRGRIDSATMYSDNIRRGMSTDSVHHRPAVR